MIRLLFTAAVAVAIFALAATNEHHRFTAPLLALTVIQGVNSFLLLRRMRRRSSPTA